ncbi:MAG TPA: phosphatase PAP2 family protein [Galbitalea sp.]
MAKKTRDARVHPRSDSAESAETARRVAGRWPFVSGGIGIVLVAALGALIALREGNLPFSFDTAFLGELVEHRSAFWTVPALVMNNVGAGIIGVIVIPVGIVGILCLLRKFWAAIYYAIATAVVAGLVQLLKNIFERPRPTDIMVTADLGSFPSGHTANAATMAVVLGFVLQRYWVWIAGALYTIAMLLSRTYLGAHWLSDTIGGLVLGVAVAVMVWAPLAVRLHDERLRRRSPFSLRRAPDSLDQ